MPRADDRLAVEQLDLERLVLGGDLGGALGQEARSGHVRGQVLQVARGVGGLGRHAGALQRRLRRAQLPGSSSSDSIPPPPLSRSDLKRSKE